MRLLITIITCFIAGLGVSAAEKVLIHGKIIDQANEPVEFATVKIAGTSTGTTSSINGDYRLSFNAPDTVIVVFSCIGYREERRTLINAKGDLTLNMRLTANTKLLKEVEVKEIKKQTDAMQRISADDYKFSADPTGGSVESLISTMAGVSQGNEMTSQYSVRGGSYDENSVYINGVEVYRPLLITTGQQEGLSIINPDMVGAIGFSTGGFPAEYADKMSSVLDITYRQPQSFEGSLSASLMGASLSIGQSKGRFSQLHGIRYKRNNSLLSSLETKGEYDPDFFDYQTNMSLKLSDKFSLSFLGNIALNNYRFKPTDRTTNFGTLGDTKRFKVYFDGHEKDKFETWFGALTLHYTPSKQTKMWLTASGFLTNELVTYDISGEYWLDKAGGEDDDEVIGGELGVGRYHEHARNRIKASVISGEFKGATAYRANLFGYGVSFKRESIMERSYEWERRDSAGFSQPVNPDALKLIYNLASVQDLSSTRLGAFLQDNIRIPSSAGYFNINAGVRLSHWSFNKEFLVSPRVNVGFVPEAHPSWAFRLTGGLYYQSPFYKEIRMPLEDKESNTTIALNKDIKSQRSVQVIAGTEYTFRAFNRPFKLSAEAYYKALSDIIPYEIDNLRIIYTGQNQTSGYAMGLDFKLFGQFVPGSDSWISFSLMKSQETLNGVKVPRPNDRRYNMAVYFTDYFPRIPRLRFSLRGILSDGLPMTTPRSSRDVYWFRTPAYKRVDVGLAYGLLPELKEGETRSGLFRHIKSVWLGLDVFNLLDISNVSSYYWVTDVNNIQYAVPNYLTRRQFNVKLSINF